MSARTTPQHPEPWVTWGKSHPPLGLQRHRVAELSRQIVVQNVMAHSQIPCFCFLYEICVRGCEEVLNDSFHCPTRTPCPPPSPGMWWSSAGGWSWTPTNPDSSTRRSLLILTSHFHLPDLCDIILCQLILFTTRWWSLLQLIIHMSQSVIHRPPSNSTKRSCQITHKVKKNHATSHPFLPLCIGFPSTLEYNTNVLLLTYKALHGQASIYIQNLIHHHIPHRSLRSSDMGLLSVPWTRLKTKGDRSF